MTHHLMAIPELDVPAVQEVSPGAVLVSVPVAEHVTTEPVEGNGGGAANAMEAYAPAYARAARQVTADARHMTRLLKKESPAEFPGPALIDRGVVNYGAAQLSISRQSTKENLPLPLVRARKGSDGKYYYSVLPEVAAVIPDDALAPSAPTE